MIKSNLKIYFSFDYELFFGNKSGSVEKCMLAPTKKLIEIASKYGVQFIFFVDAGYIYQLKKYSHVAQCVYDYNAISSQLKELISNGHQIALHIHPHWEDCVYNNNAWKINTKRYKLSDFSEAEVESIVTKYHDVLKQIIGLKCTAYRAGGWCVQPFTFIKNALIKNDIFIDSSVYHRGHHTSDAHSYDFRHSPNEPRWKFSDDPCEAKKNGLFTEIAITHDKISPLFYWNLYFKMRQNPHKYIPMGDGKWLVDKKRIYKHFFISTPHFACADGFFASRLKRILLRTAAKNKSHMMILSHPKSLAEYSFSEIERFIISAQSQGHSFNTLNDL